MRRYFFHIHDGASSLDDEGTELPSLDAAREEALRTAGELLRDRRAPWNGTPWRMEVTDEAGEILFTLGFSLEASALALARRGAS